MRRLGVVLAVAVVLAVFAAVHMYHMARSPRYDPVCDHASTRTNRYGTKGMRELLHRSGLRTSSWNRPWDQLDDAVGVLWVIDPAVAPSARETRRLLEWVRGGGWALIAPDPRLKNRGVSPGVPAVDVVTLARLGWGLLRTGAPQNRTVRVAPAGDLTRDVNRILVPAGWRLLRNASQEHIRRSLRRTGASTATIADPPDAVAKLEGQALIRDAYGIIAAQVKHGKGRIVLLCDADMIANATIDKADNVVLAANLTFASGADAAWFDEYRHGRQQAAEKGLDTAASMRPIWAAIIAVGLFLLGKFWRFGQPIPMDPPPRRSSLEYIRAFAILYEKAGQKSAVLQMIQQRFRTRLAFLSGAPANAPASALADAVAVRRPEVDARQLAAVLDRCRSAVQGDRPVSDQVLLELTRSISRMEQELGAHEL